MGLEGRKYTDQHMIYRQGNENTAVYDRLEGSNKLYNRARNYLINHPDEVTNISFVGAPGSGKETTAGQLVYKLHHDKKLGQYLHDTGKTLDISYISLGDTMDAAQELGWTESEWGHFTPYEFAVGSILMRDAIAAKNEGSFQMIDDGSSVFIPRKPDPSTVDVVLVESVAVASPLNLGTFALQYLGDKPNHFCHALVRNDEVQARAREFRDTLFASDTTSEKLRQVMEEVGSQWDIELTENQIVEIRKSMGNTYAINRINEVINKAILEAKDQNELPELLIVIDEHALNSNPQARSEAEREYLKHVVSDVWGVRKNNAIIAENEVIDDTKVKFFRGLIDPYKIDIISLLNLRK